MDNLQNFVLGFIRAGQLYNDEAYQIQLAEGDGVRFPDPAQDDFGAYDVVWYNSQDYVDASLDPNVEIVRVIAKSGDNLTLANNGSARIPQQGTTASNKNTPFRKYAIYLATTKKTFDEINEAIETVDARIDDANEAIGVVAQDLADFEQDTANALSGKIPNTEKGEALGVASLDGGGKVPVTQLPSSVMEFKGVWNADTNTPILADGVGDAGDVYLVSVAGTHNFGSGEITFAIGDWAIYDGTIWQKSLNSNAVVSVNGLQGVVTVDLAQFPNVQTALDAKVAGPASATDNAIPVYDGATGKLLKNSDLIYNATGLGIGGTPTHKLTADLGSTGDTFNNGIRLKRGDGFIDFVNRVSDNGFLPTVIGKPVYDSSTIPYAFSFRGVRISGMSDSAPNFVLQAANEAQTGAISASQVAFAFRNWATDLITVLGDGKTTFEGNITANRGITIGGEFINANHTITSSGGSLYILGQSGNPIYIRPAGTGGNAGLITLETTGGIFSGTGGYTFQGKIEVNSSTDIPLITSRYSNTDNAFSGVVSQRARGSLASPSAVRSGDTLMAVAARGYHSGGAFSGSRGLIEIRTTENWTSEANGTEIVIQTTPNGSTKPATAITIGQAQEIGMGITPNSGYILSTNGAVVMESGGATVLTIVRRNSTGSAGIGFRVGSSGLSINARIEAVGIDSNNTDFVFQTQLSGTTSEKFRMSRTGRFMFGGTGSGVPSLKPDGLGLRSRSADDSVDAYLGASFLDLAEIATPSNPSAGYNKLYFKSDDKLYILNSAGVELEVATV